YSDEQIAQIEVWCNGLPRKALGYRTPDELFEGELDRIYSCAA
ncbi:MAG: IS30 family transposase, partial [Firmicutes bacterium]|nr:IS30 family transposase [Bacillota bacterium]